MSSNPETGPGASGNGWESLRDALGLQPHELGHRLASQAEAVPWTDVAKPFAHLTVPSTGASSKRLLVALANSAEPSYFAAVVEGRVSILYGLKVNPDLNQDGGVYSALLGDSRAAGRATIYPALHRLEGCTTLTDHSAWFKTKEVRARTADEIAAALAANTGQPLIDPIPDEEDAPSVTSHLALPVHPKVACLLLRMPSVRAASMRL